MKPGKSFSGGGGTKVVSGEIISNHGESFRKMDKDVCVSGGGGIIAQSTLSEPSWGVGTKAQSAYRATVN